MPKVSGSSHLTLVTLLAPQAGALGSYAAATELAFGTMIQRVMAYPGRVRMHYGHPDVFNKVHIMSQVGGQDV